MARELLGRVGSVGGDVGGPDEGGSMTMLNQLTNHGSMPALVHVMSFNESRLRVLADNMANLHTPGYHARFLDAAEFQRSLAAALKERGGDPTRPLAIRGSEQVSTDELGSLRTNPSERPPGSVMAHDGTNHSLERHLADLAETGMTHELATTLYRTGIEGLRKAIRGTV